MHLLNVLPFYFLAGHFPLNLLEQKIKYHRTGEAFRDTYLLVYHVQRPQVCSTERRAYYEVYSFLSVHYELM